MKTQQIYAIPEVEFLTLSDTDLLTASGGGENSIELDEIEFKFEIH